MRMGGGNIPFFWKSRNLLLTRLLFIVDTQELLDYTMDKYFG